MVIDLTRRPVVVNTDVCTAWIVVRTAANREVDGILRRRMDQRQVVIDRYANGRPNATITARAIGRRGRGERRMGDVNELRTEVELPTGDGSSARILKESRLPIDHLVNKDPHDPLPNPFEVATLYVDGFTGTMGTWRAQLILGRVRNKNGEYWQVTVRDEGARIDLVTVTAKDLAHGQGLGFDEVLPLQRLSSQAPSNTWERLRQISQVREEIPDDDA